MAFQKLFTYLSILLLSIFADARPTNCLASVRVISVRGTDEVFGQSCLREVFSSVLSSGANAVLQGTPYPAIMDNSNWSVYGGSVTQGVNSLKSIIQDAVAQCPLQKIVLIGYSQGANVIGDTLCSSTVTGAGQLSEQYADHIAAVVMFGDPTHVVGQVFAQGGAYQNGMVPRTNNMQCAPYTNKIASFCHPNDPVCATGSDISQHLNYMPALDAQAAEFIMSKVR